MKKNIKRLAGGSVGVTIVVFLFWCTGYDFDTRGEFAFFTAFVSLIAGGFGAAFPYDD